MNLCSPRVAYKPLLLVCACALLTEACAAQTVAARRSARTHVASRADDTSDTAAIRASCERYYEAYAARDAEDVMRSWSAIAPRRAAYKIALERFFGENLRVELRGLTVGEILLDAPGGAGVPPGAPTATARVTFEIRTTPRNPSSSLGGFERGNRRLRFVQERGVWRLWDETIEEDDRAAELAAADAERRRALVASLEASAPEELVRAVLRRGRTSFEAGRNAEALDLFRLARDVAARLKVSAGGRDALYEIGRVHERAGDYAAARLAWEECLRSAEQDGDGAGAARALNYVGSILRLQGDYDSALAYFERSVQAFERLGAPPGIASPLNQIGNVHYVRGDYDRALAFYTRALEVYERIDYRPSVATLLNNVGNVHRAQGSYREALACYSRSLAVAEGEKDAERAAATLYNIGVTLRLQGALALAQDKHEQALKMVEMIGHKEGVANNLIALGVLRRLQGDYAGAVELFDRCLALRVEMKDRSGIARAQNMIGETLYERGRAQEAALYSRRALAGFEEVGDKRGITEALADIGAALVASDSSAEGLKFARRAADAAELIGSPELLWRALSVVGAAQSALGDRTAATDSFERAVNVIERLGAEVAGSVQERRQFFENKVSPYRNLVLLAARSNRPEAALAYAERARARVLLDVLRGGRLDPPGALTGQERAREHELLARLTSLNVRLAREQTRPQSPAARSDARLKDLRAEVEAARLAYERFRLDLYAARPELKARRGEAEPLAPAQIASLLPPGAALAEFVVTEDATFLLLLTKGRSDAPPVLTLREIKIDRRELTRRVEDFREQIARRDLNFARAARELYDLLLAPAGDVLRGLSRLVLVPDDALWNLPFQALQNESNRFLIEDAAISYVPSAAVLGEMRRRAAATSVRADGGSLLAFGASDSDAAARSAQPLATSARRASYAAGGRMTAEASMLAALYPARGTRVYAGDAANERRFKQEAGNYDLLHIAAHGVLDDGDPMYSHVALAAGAGEDGLLEAREIAQLDLRARLAVLSACETARGRISPGEGVIGLSWALFVAGVPAVVVSEWKVDSASTADLMVGFHRRLRAQPRPAIDEALRGAALYVMRDGAHRHPFYWAGFVLIGDGG